MCSFTLSAKETVLGWFDVEGAVMEISWIGLLGAVALSLLGCGAAVCR